MTRSIGRFVCSSEWDYLAPPFWWRLFGASDNDGLSFPVIKAISLDLGNW